MSAADTLRKCVALLKQVDFADCAESPELWHQHGLVLQEAEAVLRDGEKQEPFGYVAVQEGYDTGTVFNTSRVVSKETAEACAKQWRSQNRDYRVEVFPVYRHPVPSQQAVSRLPSTPEEAIEFIGVNFVSLDIAGPVEDRRVVMTIYDLLSAFRDWQDCAPQPAAAPSGDSLKFADHIINGVFEGCHWDGGDVQDLAVKYGLLKPETMQGPCKEEGCACAQNGAEFPSTCYRKTYVAAITATKE